MHYLNYLIELTEWLGAVWTLARTANVISLDVQGPDGNWHNRQRFSLLIMDLERWLPRSKPIFPNIFKTALWLGNARLPSRCPNRTQTRSGSYNETHIEVPDWKN